MMTLAARLRVWSVRNRERIAFAFGAIMEQSWNDILEWFEDAGLTKTAANLRGPARPGEIATAEAVVGQPMPEPLRWLYTRHDGQRSLDHYPLFKWLAFIPLHHFGYVREAMLLSYFGVERGGTLVHEDRIFDDPHEPLTKAEKNAHWWPFANTEGDYYAVHGDTGRVVWILKGDIPAIYVVANSLDDLLYDYANALWNDEFTVCGDLNEPGVVEDGMRSFRAYVR